MEPAGAEVSNEVIEPDEPAPEPVEIEDAEEPAPDTAAEAAEAAEPGNEESDGIQQ